MYHQPVVALHCNTPMLAMTVRFRIFSTQLFYFVHKIESMNGNQKGEQRFFNDASTSFFRS